MRGDTHLGRTWRSRCSYGDDAVTLRVRDDGPGPADGELLPGHGLVGMRDRATMAGGSFSAGAAEGGGFVVEATLPTCR